MSGTPFFSLYRPLFESIEGMFSFEAALLMTAYAQIAAEVEERRDTLEIGVHHGLSAILVAALRGQGSKFVAIDLFDDMQDQNTSHSGSGSQQRFLTNMARVHGSDLNFARVIAAPSSSLKVSDLGKNFSFCHVDGGHSSEETYRDLELCSELLRPSGILVLDDYFNPDFPGVSEGAVRFMIADRGERLVPLAIGFNKVVFCKKPGKRGLFSKDEPSLNARLTSRFPQLPHGTATLWEKPVLHFGSSYRSWFDFEKSDAHKLVLRDEVNLQVNLQPQVSQVSAHPGEIVSLPVQVENVSDITLAFGSQAIGVSFHLRQVDGKMVAFDNRRQYFHSPLSPGQKRVVEVPVQAPDQTGKYLLEFDLVWEGVCWFKDRGGRTAEVALQVS
jgi:SAM-dependent methyltransferase